jgi:hypothetical protein
VFAANTDFLESTDSGKEAIVMAAGTGTAPAREPQADVKTETAETSTAQPVTLKERIQRLLSTIFEGREEHAGWHQ